MEQENFKHPEITEKIIKAFYNVYNKLGFGFLERCISMQWLSNCVRCV